MNSVCGAGAARVVSIGTGGVGDVSGLRDDSVYSRGNEKEALGVAIAESM